MDNLVAFIFARGGSKKLPKKNIKNFNGLPLIAHTINLAKKSKLFSDIVVSTDDQEIADTAKEFGANVPFLRPKDLAEDNSPEWLCWKHAINKYNKKIDHFFSLPCTSPLKSITDLEKMIDFYKRNEFDLVLGISSTNHSPYFNMVTRDINNRVMRISDPDHPINRRQDAPECFNITTVGYLSNPKYILREENIFSGNVGGIEIPKERSIDIDDEIDFFIAESLSKRNNNYEK